MAWSLKRTAEILWNTVEKDMATLLAVIDDDEVEKYNSTAEPGIEKVFMFIAGLAIENLIKALCITREGALDKRGGFRNNLTTHKLLNLLEDAGIPLSDEENDLAERLEQYVLWAGRYPIPRKYDDMLPRTDPNGGYGSLELFKFPSDGLLAFSLIDKLEKKLGIMEKVQKKHNINY